MLEPPVTNQPGSTGPSDGEADQGQWSDRSPWKASPIPSCRAFALGQEQLVGADWQGKGGQTRTLVINCSCWPRLEFPLSANPDLQDPLKRSVPILVTFCRDDQWTIYDNKTPWILHGGGFFVASPAHINGRDHWWNDGIVADRNHWMIGHVFVFSLKLFFSRHLFHNQHQRTNILIQTYPFISPKWQHFWIVKGKHN